LLLLNNNFLVMDSAKTLYQILNLIIILILLSIGVGILLFGLIFFGILPIETAAMQSDLLQYTKDPGLYVFIILILAVYGVFIYGALKLRQATKLLVAHKFYTTELTSRVILSGKCMIITGVFAWLVDGLSSLYFKQEIQIGLSEKTFIYLFMIAMGLFMMLMGKVLEDAKNLKEESDLTI